MLHNTLFKSHEKEQNKIEINKIRKDLLFGLQHKKKIKKKTYIHTIDLSIKLFNSVFCNKKNL